MSDETNTPLVGKLIEAGDIGDCGKFQVHGIVIDCGKEVLQKAKIPFYSYVLILHAQSTTVEILDFMNRGIPLKTLKEVHEGLGAIINPDSR